MMLTRHENSARDKSQVSAARLHRFVPSRIPRHGNDGAFVLTMHRTRSTWRHGSCLHGNQVPG